MKWQAIIIPLFVHFAFAASPPCSGMLQCWLQSLVFHIPTLSFEVDHITIVISEMECGNIQLQSLESSLSDHAYELEVDANGLGLQCTGHWTVSKLQGDINLVASSSKSPALGVSLLVDTDSKHLEPTGVKMLDCSANLDIADIQFTGMDSKILEFLLDFAAWIIKGGIAKEINIELCSLLQTATNSSAAVFGWLDHAIEPLVQPGAAAPHPIPSSPSSLLPLVNWTYVPVFTSAIQALNKVLSNGLSAPSCLGLNDIIDKITHGTGAIILDHLGLSLNLHLRSLANVTFTLQRVNISGLDTFNQLQVLNPTDNGRTMTETIGLGSLRIDLQARVQVSLDGGILNGSSLDEVFVFSLGLSNTSLLATNVIDMEIDLANNLYVAQLTDLACWLSTVYSLNFTHLILDSDISLISITPMTPGSLELGLDGLMNNVFGMVTRDFHTLISDVIMGVTNQPLLTAVNSLLTEILVQTNLPPAMAPVDPSSSPPLSSSPATAVHTPSTVYFSSSSSSSSSSPFSWFSSSLSNGLTQCKIPQFPTPPDPSPIWWDNSSVIRSLDYLLNDVIGARGVNSFLQCLTTDAGTEPSSGSGSSGSSSVNIFSSDDDLVSVLLSWLGFPVSASSSSTLSSSTDPSSFSSSSMMLSREKLTRIYLTGLDTLYLFTLLSPVDHFDLLNQLAFANCSSSHRFNNTSPPPPCTPFAINLMAHIPSDFFPPESLTLDSYSYSSLLARLRLLNNDDDVVVDSSYDGLFGDDNSGGYINNHTSYDNLTVSVRLSELAIGVLLDLVVDSQSIGQLQLEQVVKPGCALSTLTDLQLKFLQLSLGDFEVLVNFSRVDGSSSSFVLHERKITRDINILLNATLHVLQNTLNNDLTADRLDAPATCSGANPHPPASRSLVWVIPIVVVLVSSVLILVLFLYLQGKANNCRRGVRRALSRVGFAEYNAELEEEQEELEEELRKIEQERKKPPIDWYDSLLFRKPIPAWIRYPVVVVLLANIALFLSSNLTIAANVEIVGYVGRQSFAPPPLFSFSLANTVRDMWSAGVYPLAIIIAVFSGIWPYGKLTLMLFAWVVPAGVCGPARRETLLVWLDRLGKWSLIDNFVLVMMVVAFRFHIAVIENEVVVDVVVNPVYGFYSFLFATMMSLAVSHIILAFHRVSELKVPIPEGGAKEALRSHSHRRAQKDKPDYTCGYAGEIIMLVFLLACTSEMCWGVYIQAFNFDFRGLAAWALGLLGSPTSQPYSLVTVGVQLPESSSNPDGFGIRWIQASYFAFALGMPFMYMLVLLILWVFPMTIKLQRQMFVLSEVLYAWSAIDVFIISVIAALLELSTFAQFIIGDKCDLINQILASIGQAYPDFLAGDDKCFDVVATLNEGCWVLFGASVIFSVVGLIMSRLCNSAIEDRLRDQSQFIPLDDALNDDVNNDPSD